MDTDYTIGIDVGTSGVRAVVIDRNGKLYKNASARLDTYGRDRRDPAVWWAATDAVLTSLAIDVEVRGICVDATSGTVLAIDSAGEPLGKALMYNDRVEDSAILDRIASVAPPDSAVHGASSALARAISLQHLPGVSRIVHQADWIVGRLSSCFDVSDESNALKTGYDPVQRRWPQWLRDAGMVTERLPQVVPAGGITGQVSAAVARRYNLPAQTRLVAGVSDGCASFLATGAGAVGDCVTALGSTITMKMLCDKPLFNPDFGVYSHRIGDRWLAGGASNSGGNVLAHFFPAAQDIEALSAQINPEQVAKHQYYPLLSAGERFPHNDAEWPPCLSPRPVEDEQFLHCLFEGMANIEVLGYQRLRELGAPAIGSMRTVGGGAGNPAWTGIRQRVLKVPFKPSVSTEAAFGVALLARESLK